MTTGKSRGRVALEFAAAVVAGTWIHELGHVVVAWSLGLAAVPTPLKEYLLVDEIDWGRQVWISLGGVAGSVVATVGAIGWYLARERPDGDHLFAGIALMPWAYTLRFLLMGRGHGDIEWQEAQFALAMNPNGHFVDYLFAALTLAGAAVWIRGHRSGPTRRSLARAFGLLLGGFFLVGVLQSSNNALFDRFFPNTRTLNVPPGIRPE